METVFAYLGKMILSSAIMFGYYHLVLKDKTFHHYNRFYLLAIVVVSLLLPIIKISYFTIEVNKSIYLLFSTLKNFNSPQNTNDDFNYIKFLAPVVGLVSAFFLAKLISAIYKIQTFKNQFPKEKIEGISFFNTNLENAPFSYFRNLFWKNSILLNSDLGRQILKHEMVHIEQKHSFDKLFLEFVVGIFWFNPIFWFIKKEMNLIHEYLADKKAVKNADTKAFAQMLLASHFSGTVIPTTSPFLNSNLKKRLKMLQKPQTKFGYVRRILALPIVFTLAFAYMVNAKNKEITQTNRKIEKAVSEIKNDTVKTTVTATAVLDTKNEFSIDEKLKKSTEKSLFLINGEEVSRNEYIDFYKKNKNNRKFVISYHSYEGNEHLYKEFGVLGPYGEYEKHGVFQADDADKFNDNVKKYHKIQDKYAPEWRKYLKSLENTETQKRLENVLQEKQSKKSVVEDQNKVIVINAKSYTTTGDYEEGEYNLSKNPIAKSLNEASEKDEFKIENEIVSKKEFEDFFNKNAKNKYYVISMSQFFQNTDGKKSFVMKKRPSYNEDLIKNNVKLFKENYDISKTDASHWPNKNQNEIEKTRLDKPLIVVLKNNINSDSKIKKYYHNNKEISFEDINKINPQKINIIRATKKGSNGATEDAIYIITK